MDFIHSYLPDDKTETRQAVSRSQTITREMSFSPTHVQLCVIPTCRTAHASSESPFLSPESNSSLAPMPKPGKKKSAEVKREGFRVRVLSSIPSSTLAVQSWASYLIPPPFSFLICKMGVMRMPCASETVIKIKEDSTGKTLRTVPGIVGKTSTFTGLSHCDFGVACFCSHCLS